MTAIRLLAWALLPLATAAPADAWRWPVEGEVLTRYRNGSDAYARGQHRGIDIAAAVGSPVAAAAAGTVRFAGAAGSSGLVVSVRTADGRLDTSYLHLSSVRVRTGQPVRLGHVLGTVGVSGRRSSPAPHLHFGVREAGTRHSYRDPLALLPARPVAAPRPAPPGAGRLFDFEPHVARPVRPAAARAAPGPPGPRPTQPLRAERPRVPRPDSPPRPVAARPLALGPAPRSSPGPSPRRLPAGPSERPAAAAVPARDLDPGWAAACLGLLLAAWLLSRSATAPLRGPARAGGARRSASSIAVPCRTTSRPRSTT